MTRTASRAIAGVTACITITIGITLSAQRFTSHAVAVRVDVLVTDGKTPVPGLTAADFEVRDAGVVQNVKQIDIEQLPLNLVLTVDTSQSVEGTRMTALLDAARRLVGALREPDRVALLSFSTRVRLLSPLTPSRPQITAALNQLSASGATSLRDAVFSALALREDDPGRTLLLVFSDGNDTSSWLTTPKVMEAARRTDAVVYAVGIRQQAQFTGYSVTPLSREPTVVTRTQTVEEMGEFLRKVTEETGGRALFASTDADLRGTFARTLDEFRNRYVLSYTPTGVAATGWHTLNVKLKSKRGKVTARRGYFADLPPSR
jgi:Ca-activated chloride channel family protein